MCVRVGVCTGTCVGMCEYVRVYVDEREIVCGL